MASKAGTFKNGAVLTSDDTFTFDADTNVITTGVDNQVFRISTVTVGGLETSRQTNAFYFKAISALINFDLNEETESRLKVALNEKRGIEEFTNLISFKVNALTGAEFEFECFL